MNLDGFPGSRVSGFPGFRVPGFPIHTPLLTRSRHSWNHSSPPTARGSYVRIRSRT